MKTRTFIAISLPDDIRRRASTVFHPVSTCRMGTDAALAVVDSRLKVHGLAGLRVIDASVFPAVTSGNTNAPTMMVAEKGADLVLAELGFSAAEIAAFRRDGVV